jgi:hypothetical protein
LVGFQCTENHVGLTKCAKTIVCQVFRHCLPNSIPVLSAYV